MTFSLVYPIIMGSNIGTCIVTAFLCSVGTSRDAKRVAAAHIIFNVIGTIMFMIGMTVLHRLGVFSVLWDKIVDSGDIANFQTLFNLITAAILLPFTNQLVALSSRIIRKDAAENRRDEEAGLLDSKLLISPGLALAEAGKAIARMGALATENLSVCVAQLLTYDPQRCPDIADREDRLDGFADQADTFLIALSKRLDANENEAEMNLLMQAVPDFERIGDYATTIDELAQRLAGN